MTQITTNLTLECIDGKDDHFIVEFTPGAMLTLGHYANNADREILELNANDGIIGFSFLNGVLLLDASVCKIPVKINGKLVDKAVVHAVDILRIGDSIWKAHYPASESIAANLASTANSINRHFTSFIGLEGLQDFKLKDVFSEIFKKHSLLDMEDQLITGTARNTPAITDIETGWAKPWLFARLLLLAVVLTVLLVIGFNTFQNLNLVPGLIFIGSFAVPLATLIFFLEMNAPRNISIFMVIVLLFIGGVASLILAILFFRNLDFFSSILGASAAGIIEESAKLLIVVALLGRFRRYKWILNGMLFGAAIGCGFGAFESAGYAFRAIIDNGVDAGINSILLRGLLAPFMHIVWTANAAAALWLVKGDKKFSFEMLGDMRFLRVLVSSMLLHMIWNAPFSTIPLPIVIDLKFPLLGIIAYIICFRLVQTGLKQLNEARKLEVERLQAS